MENSKIGIALNALYEKAFDRHLISFDEDFRLVLSNRIKAQWTDERVQEYFLKLEGKSLEMPFRFALDKDSLGAHRDKCVQLNQISALCPRRTLASMKADS
ncbi:MAG TPA: hypothetical protein PK002_05170 [Cellvibrio sp.]|nr:hypothetical protein [Cellvibrio sp.]